MVSANKQMAIVWLAFGLWGLGTLFFFGSLFQPSKRFAQADTLVVPPNRLIIQANGPLLLESDGLTVIMVTNHHLLLNQDSLPFNSTNVAGMIKIQPQQQARWRNYLSLLLREQGQYDSTKAWQTARLKLLSFVSSIPNPNQVVLTDEQLIERFVTTVKQNQQEGESTLIRRGQLIHERLSVRKLTPKEQLQTLVNRKGNNISSGDFLSISRISFIVLWVAIALLIWIIWIIWCNSGQSIQLPQVVTDLAEALQEPPSVSESTEPIFVTDEVCPDEPIFSEPQASDLYMNGIEQYITAFLEHYGGFYKRIQQLPLDASDEERRLIRRELVEMALHANDFMKACTYKDPKRLGKAPNVQLLISGLPISGLSPELYRTLSLDPYQTEKRYRLLVRVLQEMDIGELEGALLNDVYVPKALLTSPNHFS